MLTRSVEAATLTFTGVVGRQTNKARCLSAWQRQAIRAVVNVLKATGAGVTNSRRSKLQRIRVSGHIEARNLIVVPLAG